MRAFKNFLLEFSTKKMLIVSLILTYGIYGLMLVLTAPRVTAHTGGMTLPDLMPLGYDHAYMVELYRRLGEAGSEAYRTQIALDMVYALFFWMNTTLLIVFLYKKLHYENARFFWWILLFPFLAGMLDVVENIFFYSFTLSHNFITPSVVKASSVISIGKYSSIAVCGTIVIVLVSRIYYEWARGRKN